MHFPRGSCPGGVYDDRGERLLIQLVGALSRDIDTGQPAAVSRMTVVPANAVLMATHLEHSQSLHSTAA